MKILIDFYFYIKYLRPANNIYLEKFNRDFKKNVVVNKLQSSKAVEILSMILSIILISLILFDFVVIS